MTKLASNPMEGATSIRILEKDNNRRGDLFGQLMADLFIALGYERPHLNIHKSGRELDLSANHRLESRRAIAECKATTEPIGGADLNKFVGVLDVEHQDDRPVAGYFISLAGFRETAIEQEMQRRRTKIVMLTAAEVVDILVEGRILIVKDRATELAGRYCTMLSNLVLDPIAEILAHRRGWIWAIYYTQGKSRTHFALIHSDGTHLARAIADEVIADDSKCGGELHKLSCLNPSPLFSTDTDLCTTDALAAYRKYLANECGFIQLDGLPADSDVGSRRLKLENLFVPLHLDVTTEDEEEERQPVGTILSNHPRLALLAAPGGGKSTLIKHLAITYIDSTQDEGITDSPPQRNWLPLFFRCRELRDLARASFSELLDALSQREPVRQYSKIFRRYVDQVLLTGHVLLLVDGLDEISDSSDRAAFVCTLRSALQAYPDIGIVITSREAGFRHVAAHLAPVCTYATLSPFDENDIRHLSVAWHREVVGDTEKVRTDAIQLATTIAQNDRINRLAVNPLLLTTLLLVKRWVGSLPTRRAILYGKAVEVLLMTWNVEGHDPIPDEEALPQLCYVASAMMLRGIQKVSRPQLAALLQEARNALPTELGYAEGTVDAFIHRVEDRSSLLMMSGYDVEDGQLVEFFEFRHLTFQEFLTARAMVQGWHPNRVDNDTLVGVLTPHFEEEAWREVIPLSAVLGGKATEALIQELTNRARGIEDSDNAENSLSFVALVNCLADEAAARPGTIHEAVRELVRLGSALRHIRSIRALARGRYGMDLRREAGRAFIASEPDFSDSGNALVEVIWWQIVDPENTGTYLRTAEQFIQMLSASDELTCCEGASGLSRLCSRLLHLDNGRIGEYSQALKQGGEILTGLLFTGTVAEYRSAAFALSPLLGCRVWVPDNYAEVLARLFDLWRESSDEVTSVVTARALASLPLLASAMTQQQYSALPRSINELLTRYDTLTPSEKAATIVISWHIKALDKSIIAERIKSLIRDPRVRSRLAVKFTLDEILTLVS